MTPVVSTPVSHPLQAKAVLLLREVWSPMSDAQIPIVMGTLAALTKDATWTYRAQQVLAVMLRCAPRHHSLGGLHSGRAGRPPSG